MTKNTHAEKKAIETIVKLFGDEEENINNILSGMELNSVQSGNLRTLLHIFYHKIDNAYSTDAFWAILLKAICNSCNKSVR